LIRLEPELTTSILESDGVILVRCEHVAVQYHGHISECIEHHKILPQLGSSARKIVELLQIFIPRRCTQPVLGKFGIRKYGNENIIDCPLVKKVFAALDRKSLEITRVQREIDALLIAARLLAE
jgi:hypothetical protein